MDEEDTSLDLSYYQPSTPYHKKISALDPTIYNPTTPDGDHFCTPGNLSATAEYVNHQLISHGYPAPLRFINNDKSDASKIINCIFALLQQIEKDNGQHEDMMDNLHNQQSENGALTTNMAKLKQQLEQSERNVDTLKAKLNTCEENLKAETSRHKDTHEELQKAKQNLQHIKTQYAHELRKREQEYGKLKDRMQKVLNDKYKGSKISLTLVNPAPKSSTLPSKSDLSQDEEMFRENLNNYEERERMVLDENQSLRNALITLYQEIEILLRGQVAREGRTLEVPVPSGSVNARYNLRSSTISNSDHRFSSASFQQSPSAPITAETARFQMPFDMTGANIVKDLKVLLAMLKEEWEGRPANKKLLITQEREHEMKEKDKEIEKQRMEIDDLVAQLEEKRFVAEEQNKLIDRFLSGNFFQNANEEDMLNMSGMELTIPEVDEEAASLRHMREQLDQERRQFTEAAIKMGRERAALRAEREAFEEEKRSLQTQALLFSLPETPYWLKRQQAGPAQSTPILAASINSVDFELLSPFASPEPSINSKLSKNRTPYSAEYSNAVNSNPRRAASRKAQSKDEDDDVIMESDTIHTPTAISMGASQHSRTAISTRRTSNATSAANPGPQFPRSALKSGSIRGNTTVTSRNAKREVTIAANDIFRASFAGSKQLTMSINTGSVGKSRERSSPTEEVSPQRANKHPRLDSTAVQEGAEFDNNDTERENYMRGQDTPQPQSTRATVRVSRRSSVVSQGVKENIKPSAPASQDRSGKMVSAGPSSAAGQRDFKTKMQLLQSANAKFRATGALSPTPTSTSSRSLASVATKAAANAPRRQQPARVTALSTTTNLTRSTSSVVSSRNSSLTSSESSEENSSGSTVMVSRTAVEKKAVVASAVQEGPDKSRRVRGRVSSGPSKMSAVATTTRGRG